ncbi:hypothetical protein CFC21_030493 [Triticum aestivum]|uniref:Uncharacterized protein n=4 Tax=Triticinae TaxID=1648030 RepID=A0A9R1J2Q0_WHEAT|nr:uncharacterized protein LOC109746702 [Aegilops tauschii subsp. strangulata]XP_037478208.1 uncharacterized protein LOC119355500 [Triticum dicoccoides]XP_044333118.1 uncharacterized protein LOC123053665 [Triticum aestivum]XP_044457924.1 uncharacterized protein LOC123189547 [Triticum aestivum]XP_048557973.1 uncharacterized protein LOC125538740 [Triticum urartu]KAF7002080.1 hypothetical protein CFC21_017618 [Triticum aestivum]KAF7016991.1 hypothetical protein CFC21_030493 [Triticum aestivum]
MSSLGTSKGILEIAKFGVYVAVPVTLTYLVATDSKAIKKLMGLRPYVVYPPEGPRPPPPEELRERAREIARSRRQE